VVGCLGDALVEEGCADGAATRPFGYHVVDWPDDGPWGASRPCDGRGGDYPDDGHGAEESLDGDREEDWRDDGLGEANHPCDGPEPSRLCDYHGAEDFLGGHEAEGCFGAEVKRLGHRGEGVSRLGRPCALVSRPGHCDGVSHGEAGEASKATSRPKAKTGVFSEEALTLDEESSSSAEGPHAPATHCVWVNSYLYAGNRFYGAAASVTLSVTCVCAHIASRQSLNPSRSLMNRLS
jgi:hypothetical protein